MDSSARMPKKRMQICSSEGPQTSFRRIELWYLHFRLHYWWQHRRWIFWTKTA
jgi:hypothetical protein